VYQTRQYGSNARWLVKALREVAGEIEELVRPLDAGAARFRPAPGAWSIAEALAVHAHRAREDLAAVRAVLRHDGAPLAESQAPFLPTEHDLHRRSLRDALDGFLLAREELLWTLVEAEHGWEHALEHPHRGRVPLPAYLHEINERDLETAWTVRLRLREQGLA